MFDTFKRAFRISAIVLTLMCACATVADAAVFYSYGYNSDEKAVASPEGALPKETVTGDVLSVGDFSSPGDIFINENKIYIADTKNNRIVITDTGFANTEIIDRFIYDGKEEHFSEPNGLCAAGGLLYIADTGNSRIVVLNLDGSYKSCITAPNDPALPDDFFFKPAKIDVDSYGRIFVISTGYNMGLMQFDSDNTYLKSFGAPKVSLSPAEQIWRKLSTKAQQERTQSVVPTEYSNLSIDKEGFIYVTSESASKEINSLRKLNANGTDVLDGNGFFGDKVSRGITYKGNSQIVDFCETDNGGYAILDRKRSRVFVYNKENEMLYAFSGPGNYSGGLSVPTAIDYSDGKFYVLDGSKNALCVFGLTEYGGLFEKLGKARAEIDYESEASLWKQVISYNENCTLAMKGLGDAAYKNRDMKAAMEYYKKAKDREDYSKAYSFVRREWIENNVYLIIGVVIIAIIALSAVGKIYRKKLAASGKDSVLSRMNFSSYLCFHPLDGFWDLKREKRGSIGIAVFYFAAAVIIFVANNICTGFIFNKTKLDSYNILGNIAFVAAAVLLWCIAQWCVTSLMNGEGKFKDIFISVCYALRPYCTVSIIAIIISRVLLSGEGDFYYVLMVAALLWTAVLLVAGLMQTHNYTFAKTITVIIIILVVILLIVFIGMLVFALCQQFAAFIKDIVTEVSLRV